MDRQKKIIAIDSSAANEFDPASIDDLQLHLSRMEKMAAVGQLSSSVAHEMRNLLGMIRTAAFNIERSLGKKEAAIANNIDVINRSVARAREFIDNLLNLSRVSNGEPEFVDIVLLIDRLLMLFAKEVEWRRIEFIKDYHPVPLYKMDANAFQECILNLVLNAIQSIDGSGTITISIRPWKEGVSIAVKDTGCGMCREEQEKIFDRFFTTKKQGQGTGLGLTIVSNIVRNLGGEVHVRSCKGYGSTFTIQIPDLERSGDSFERPYVTDPQKMELQYTT